MIIQGLARTQIPTNTNYAVEFPTFGEIAGVNPTGVQWKGLALEEPPSWSRLTSQPGKYELLFLITNPTACEVKKHCLKLFKHVPKSALL